MSADRLINMFLRRVKDENEGEIPKPLKVIAVVTGAAVTGTFVRLHEGNDVVEMIGEHTGKPVMLRTSAIHAIEQFEV